MTESTRSHVPTVPCPECGDAHPITSVRAFSCGACDVQWQGLTPHCWVCGAIPDPVARRMTAMLGRDSGLPTGDVDADDDRYLLLTVDSRDVVGTATVPVAVTAR